MSLLFQTVNWDDLYHPLENSYSHLHFTDLGLSRQEWNQHETVNKYCVIIHLFNNVPTFLIFT